LTIVDSCLTYLQHYNSSNNRTLTKQDLETFPLLGYAAQLWYYHATLQRGGLVNREVAFLQSDAARKSWLRVHNPDDPSEKPFQTLLNDKNSAVYYASLFGLRAVVKNLLDKCGEVDAEGSEYSYALYAASGKGYAKVVQLLLDRGANVNAKSGRHGAALYAASGKCYTEMVKLLLDRGVDVNAQGGNIGNALPAALWGGYREIVQLLQAAGARDV